ncbi:hypothetical protein OIU78_006225 [Salix suchowensis]|nr:hypothetical protein OIU78_006225 [Salix suchowensis]
MEVNSVSSLSNEKQSSEHSTSTNVEHTSTNVEHMNTEKEKSTSVFVNHAGQKPMKICFLRTSPSPSQFLYLRWWIF